MTNFSNHVNGGSSERQSMNWKKEEERERERERERESLIRDLLPMKVFVSRKNGAQADKDLVERSLGQWNPGSEMVEIFQGFKFPPIHKII